MNRLSEEDIEEFTKLAVPRWFAWANKDKVAARIFKIQRTASAATSRYRLFLVMA